jgi:hypothetical protein
MKAVLLAAAAVVGLSGCAAEIPAAIHDARHASAKPAPLTAVQRQFVAAYSAALSAQGEQLTATPAKAASVGEQVCAIRKGGTTQSAVLSGVKDDPMVKLAERYFCPQYLPRVLLRMSGEGIKDSAPFTVNDGTLTVRYSYDCASQGTGNFIADMTDGSDYNSIANALSAGGHDTTTVYPSDVGSEYHVEVNSECSWTLTVTSG